MQLHVFPNAQTNQQKFCARFNNIITYSPVTANTEYRKQTGICFFNLDFVINENLIPCNIIENLKSNSLRLNATIQLLLICFIIYSFTEVCSLDYLLH